MSAPAPDEPAPEQTPTTLAASRARGYYITPQLPLRGHDGGEAQRCVNDEAIWVLTSARPGNGIPQLLSDNVRRGRPFYTARRRLPVLSPLSPS